MKTSKVIMSELPRYITQLEQEIRSPGIITPEKYNQLHQEIDIVLDALKKGSATTARPLKDRIVTLCGELENRVEQDQLQAIQKTAEELAKLVKNYQEAHLPSLADKKILQKANHLLSSAHSQLHHQVQQNAPTPPPITTLHLTEETDPDFSLLEMARAVYNREMSSARKIHLSLPESLQIEFAKHMNTLMAKPFEDVTETLQALTLMSGALASSSGYPSIQQIELFFMGIPDEKPQEKPSDGKIIPFDTNI